MITIEGNAARRGVAIAVAAIVDALKGISGVSPALLQEGVNALRRGAAPNDLPEVVVITDSLAIGAAVRIPGLRTIGVAAQSAETTPGIEHDIPCVTGLPDLLRSVSEGDLVIVDGYKGVVHIDPDPQTLAHYQQMEEHYEAREVVFIASEHIPARTQSGETVLVYAVADSQTDVSTALDEGADGLLVDLRESGAELAATALIEAAGKPAAFELSYPDAQIIRAAMRFSRPGRVAVLFRVEDYANHSAEMDSIIADLTEEALSLDLDPPSVKHGAYARETEYSHSDLGLAESALAIDLRKSAFLRSRSDELPDVLPAWIGSRRAEDVIFVVGKHLQAIAAVVAAGARTIAVLPGNVGAAKTEIRSIGSEEAQ